MRSVILSQLEEHIDGMIWQDLGDLTTNEQESSGFDGDGITLLRLWEFIIERITVIKLEWTRGNNGTSSWRIEAWYIEFDEYDSNRLWREM